MNTPQAILEEIRSMSESILGDNLTGIYVHGSCAFGCFNPHKSDIDYLAVVKRPLTLDEKKRYISALLALNEKAPPKGIEMSIVLERDCRQFVHPTHYELHFSNAHLEAIARDLTAYCTEMQGDDRDLAAHFTVTRAVGFALCGRTIEEVFAPVPREAYLDSIRYDVENAERDIFEHPIYVILNLCRVLAYIEEGAVLSKAQGGQWGLAHLPMRYHGLIEEALDCYADDRSYPTEVHRDLLGAFATEMLKVGFGERV